MTTPPFTASDLAELKRLHAFWAAHPNCPLDAEEKFIDGLLDRAAAIIAALETAQEDAKDRERLDWLLKGAYAVSENDQRTLGINQSPFLAFYWNGHSPLAKDRAAIDAARKGQP